MPERQPEFETFGDSQVQALFDKFLVTPEPVLRTSDLLTQRILAEVQLVYGRSPQPLVPGAKWLRQLAEWAASFRPRAVVIAFSSVAVAALLVLSVALYTLIPVPTSIAATVPTGEILVLKPSDDSYHTYRAGDAFTLSEGDQIIARTGSVQIEMFPQQFTDVMPGAQVELAVLEDQNGSRRAELHVIDGSVRHRGFESLAAGDRYFVSTAGLVAEFTSNDFEVDAVSPTRAIVTARDGTARITAASGDRELTAGQAAEVGERFVLIYDIAPLREGPGEIALADSPSTASEEPEEDNRVHTPAVDESQDNAPFTLTAQPVVPADRGAPVTSASGDYITSTEADRGSVLTVSKVSFDETQAEPMLMLAGYGPTGSSVQVLVENRPLVTATVSAEGTWTAQTPVKTIGRFDVDVVAVNDAGQIVASANAAQMEVGPPVTTPVPTPAEQSGIIPPPGATATWTPNSNSGNNAAPTKTPTRRPTSTPTSTAGPIILFAPPLPPTATPVPTVPAAPKVTATPTDGGGPFIVIVPSPTPADTATSTATARVTPTSSATPPPSPTGTSSPTSSATPLPSATATSTASATRLPTGTATATALAPATGTATSTNTPLPAATATATSVLPTATATQLATVPTTGVNGPPAGDTPVPTLSVFPTATSTPAAQATAAIPTATSTSLPPTATSTPVVPTATPGSTLNDTGVNQSVPNDTTTTDTSTAPVPTITAPTVALPAATPTQVAPTATQVPPTATQAPPTSTSAVVTQPTATATRPPAVPNSTVSDTSTSDAPPPVPATPAPTATPAPPPTAAPTAAAPVSVVNQSVSDTAASNNSVPSAIEAAAPAAAVESVPTADPLPAPTEPPPTVPPVDALPAPVDPAATPTG